jgi:hypothetical protein
MAGVDLTSANDVLKDWYTIKRVQHMIYEDNAMLALMPKVKRFPGKQLPIPILFGNPQTTSADFATAQAATSTTAYDRFDLTRAKRYGFAFIDGETMAATSDDEGAFLKVATEEIDGVLYQMKRNLAIQLYRDGYGSIGQLNGAISGSTYTMKVREEITNIEKGMKLQFSATLSGGSLRNSGGVSTVTGVDRGAGTFTVDAGVTGATTDDYIFLKGDNDQTTTRKCIAGLEAWAPATAPSSTAFFSVDRTQDVTRLGGNRLDASTSGAPLEEVLYEGAALVGREGFKLTHYFMSYGKWVALEKALHGKVTMSTEKATANIGFEAINFRGPRGNIKVIADQNCPGNRIWGVNFDYLKMYHLKDLVHTINDDGNMLLRQASADGVEGRYRFAGNVGCTAPGSLLNIKVAA